MTKILLAALAVVWLCLGAAGQTTAFEQKAAGQQGQLNGEALKALLAIHTSMSETEAKLNQAREALKDKKNQEHWIEIKKQLHELDDRYQGLTASFEELAAGLDTETLEKKPDVDLDWSKELKDLLGPILHEVRALTERPRELERLRREIDFHKRNLPLIDRVLARLAALTKTASQAATGKDEQRIVSRLVEVEKIWQQRREETVNSLAVAEQQLADKMSHRVSIFKSAHNLFALFFKSRGLNLLLALAAALAAYLLSRGLHSLVSRLSPWHRRGIRSFYVRIWDVSFHLFTFSFTVLVFLLVLYLYGDWVLLGLALVFLFGLAWAARKGLSIFWQQIQLLLNLGAVREGERVVVNGLPWLVSRINIYSYLDNPALTDGRLRLPIRDLVNLRSRPLESEERWFPCRREDWVVLKEDCWGRVVDQTPEFVDLVELGGARQSIPTRDFIAAAPKNLSSGFRLWLTFGVDYQHQALVTEDIPGKMSECLLKGLADKGYDQDLEKLSVEFAQAGPSSLDLAILADFKGQAAPLYRRLNRCLNRLAVDACNQYGWVIPFTQITLHQAEKPIES